MKSIQDTATDVNETPPQTPLVEVEADAVADVPADPIEEIRRKYGPDIIRPASQLPPPTKRTDRTNRPKPRVASSTRWHAPTVNGERR
jgi:hypothetical protein